METIHSLSTSALNKLTTALSTTASTLSKSFLRVLSKVLAGGVVTLHKYAGFSLLQQYAESAQFEEISVNGERFSPLQRIGRRVNVPPPRAAEPSLIACSVQVLVEAGTLEFGEQLVSGTGDIFTVATSVPITGSTLSFQIRGAQDLADGELQFVRPQASLARNVTVTELVTPVAPAETPPTYRGRVQRAEAARQEGGALTDYRAWSEGVPGVLRAYPYTLAPMEVTVYVSADSETGIPTEELLTAVLAAINADEEGLAQRRPMSDAVTVLPISIAEVDIEITGLADATDEQKDQIAEALGDRLRALQPFIQGLDALPRRDVVSRADLGGVVYEMASSFGLNVVTVGTEVDDEQFERYFLEPGQEVRIGDVMYL